MKSVRACAIAVLVVLAAGCGSKHQPIPLYYMAESSLRRGELKDAVNGYRLFLNDPGPDGKPYVPRSYYMLALAYYRQGEYKQTLATLDELETVAPKNDWVQAWALRGDANRQLGKPVEALQDWDQAWRIAAPMDRRRLQLRVSDMLASMSLQELQQADAVVQEPAIHDLLAERIVAAGGSLIPPQPGGTAAGTLPAPGKRPARAAAPVKAAATGAGTTPPSQVAPPAPAPAPPPLEPRAIEVPFEDRKIACLVPLTGPDRSTGEKILAAARMAFDKSAERVVEFDTGNSVASVRTAWTAIASNSQILGVIAWIPEDVAKEVASLATTSRVPIISLSPWLGRENAYVRSWRLARRDEVSRLVDYMVHDVHIQGFGALYPSTSAGKSYFAAFQAAVKRSGAMLNGSQSFQPGQTDWSRELAQIRKWRSRHTVGAVFVPENAPRVDALATAINETFPDLILLGIAEWNGAEPARGVDQIRAFIVDTFDGKSREPASEDFAKRYQDATGTPPGGIAANAYEAAAALKTAITEDKAATRAQIRTRVLSAEHVIAPARPVLVLRLRAGKVERVSPAE